MGPSSAAEIVPCCAAAATWSLGEGVGGCGASLGSDGGVRIGFGMGVCRLHASERAAATAGEAARSSSGNCTIQEANLLFWILYKY
jgi:hypothetical protein